MNNGHLIAGSLFASYPKAEHISAEPLLELESLEHADLEHLIDCSYYMLKEEDLSKEDILRVWEIRLILMLFNNQLGAAKKEALNLNNALYLNENPGTTPAKAPTQLVYRQESGSYSKSGSPSASSTNVNQAGLPQRVVVYPLPNNNDGSVPDSLIRLLLRLKSLPNLSLVNEIYKLSYQYRLRSKPSEGYQLQAKLICSAYSTISVLIINKSYIPLLSLTESLCEDLEHVLKETNADSYRAYLSTIRMVCVWAKILYFKNKNYPGVKSISPENVPEDHIVSLVNACDPIYQLVEENTKLAMKFVFTRLVSTPCQPDGLTLRHIISSIFSDSISTRIMCCTLSVWDLEATHDTSLTESTLELSMEDEDRPLDRTYAKVISKWGDHFNKLYGME